MGGMGNLLAASNYLILRRLVIFEKEKQGKLDLRHKMRLSGAAFVATLVILAEASGQGICCYDDHPEDADYDFSVFQRHPSCSQPFTSTAPQQSSGRWVQGCSETSVYGNQQCGTRTYRGPVRGLSEGESSPGEFPWTCLILNQNNDFLGTCALVPQSFNNDLGRGTRKILTAAHNLK